MAGQLPRAIWRLRRRRSPRARPRPWTWRPRRWRLAPSPVEIMRGVDCPERGDWQFTPGAAGFDFYTNDGERHWVERADYAFSPDEIEGGDGTPTRRDQG